MSGLARLTSLSLRHSRLTAHQTNLLLEAACLHGCLTRLELLGAVVEGATDRAGPRLLSLTECQAVLYTHLLSSQVACLASPAFHFHTCHTTARNTTELHIEFKKVEQVTCGLIFFVNKNTC